MIENFKFGLFGFFLGAFVVIASGWSSWKWRDLNPFAKSYEELQVENADYKLANSLLQKHLNDCVGGEEQSTWEWITGDSSRIKKIDSLKHNY